MDSAAAQDPAADLAARSALYRWRTDPSRNLTQEETAALLGLSVARYSEIERGSGCTLARALKIQAVTGIEPKDIAPELWAEAQEPANA